MRTRKSRHLLTFVTVVTNGVRMSGVLLHIIRLKFTCRIDFRGFFEKDMTFFHGQNIENEKLEDMPIASELYLNLSMHIANKLML